ncbi:MAG: hypothetical protein ACI9B9_001692 [Halioglobus sp.]|jgi:hypothetical protein
MQIRKSIGLVLLCLFALSARADITHIALVWLSDSAPEDAAETMIEAATTLSQIPGVHDLNVGYALSSERDIVDDSFAVGISIRFRSQESLEAYLIHPLHIDYVARHIKPYSSRLQVYDIAH